MLLPIEDFKKLAADKALADTLTQDEEIYNEAENQAAIILLDEANYTETPETATAEQWMKLPMTWLVLSILLSVSSTKTKDEVEAAEVNYKKAMARITRKKKTTPAGKSGSWTGAITGLAGETW